MHELDPEFDKRLPVVQTMMFCAVDVYGAEITDAGGGKKIVFVEDSAGACGKRTEWVNLWKPRTDVSRNRSSIDRREKAAAVAQFPWELMEDTPQKRAKLKARVEGIYKQTDAFVVGDTPFPFKR